VQYRGPRNGYSAAAVVSGGAQSARRSSISRAKPVGATLCAGRPPHRSAHRERTTQSSARATVIQPTESQIQNRQRPPSSSRRLAVAVRAKTEQFIYFFTPFEKIFLNRRFSPPPPIHRPARGFIPRHTKHVNARVSSSDCLSSLSNGARASSKPPAHRQSAMVLSDVNGNGKKSAAERWLRQRNGQRASAVRCIFGPPEKRAHLMVIMRNEAEMERKRIEFAARYEPVGMSPNERRNFFAGLIKSPPTSSHHHHGNGE